MTRFTDHFSRVSGEYARFRPAYPDALFGFLAEVAPSRRTAWDCATGTGQAASGLARHFERVIATDASEEQIARARRVDRIDYRVALAESSGIPPASVALVTVAQAIHWLDLERFYLEVRRVGEPGAAVAAWCYGLSVIEPRVDEVMRWFYSERVGAYWPAERAQVESGYREMEFPFEPFEAPEFSMSVRMSLGAFLGYLGTWSAVQRAHELEGRDPRLDLGSLHRAWGDPGEPRVVSWPLSLRVGRVAPEPRRSLGPAGE